MYFKPLLATATSYRYQNGAARHCKTLRLFALLTTQRAVIYLQFCDMSFPQEIMIIMMTRQYFLGGSQFI